MTFRLHTSSARIFQQSRTAVGMLLALAALSGAVASTANAVTKTTKAKVPTTTKVLVNPCPTKSLTTVAAMNNTKYGAPIRIYKEKNDKDDPIVTLGVGIEVNGVPVFTVNSRDGDWLNVNVPRRPNGLTGWIKAAEVHTYQHSYYIVIQLNDRRLTVCNSGRVIQQEPVGVGAPSKGLTPTGNFYTVDLLRPRSGSPYGAFAFGLSGFSEDPRIENFAGGDGRIGIHGTNVVSDVGKAISHGCVRMTNAAITKLAKTIPLGVPVSIQDQ
jgi:lipoprotein-anchoring transpeptidase ErfK/SrfK